MPACRATVATLIPKAKPRYVESSGAAFTDIVEIAIQAVDSARTRVIPILILLRGDDAVRGRTTSVIARLAIL
jgi:hypothetical protein